MKSDNPDEFGKAPKEKNIAVVFKEKWTNQISSVQQLEPDELDEKHDFLSTYGSLISRHQKHKKCMCFVGRFARMSDR